MPIWTGSGTILPIVADFVPNTNNAYDLGVTATRWKNLWLAGNATIAGSLVLTGDGTVTGKLAVGQSLGTEQLNVSGLVAFNGGSGTSNALKITGGSANIIFGFTAASATANIANSLGGIDFTTLAGIRLSIGSGGNVTINSPTAGYALGIPTKTPASAAATGTAGNISWDANFIYVCTAANTWKRVAIATW
jgi:hypothetical protein